MNRVGGIGKGLRRTAQRIGWRRSAAGTGLLASLTKALAQSAGAGSADPGKDSLAAFWSTAPWPVVASLAAGIVGIVVGALVAIGFARSQSRLKARLRDASTRSSSIEPLLDAWLWQSDAEHRIVSIRPPRGAPASDWRDATPKTPLQQCFGSTDLPALNAMLTSCAEIDDLDVQFEPGKESGRPGVLRAIPVHDTEGRFAGYLGTFRSRPGLAGVAAAAAPAPTTAEATAHAIAVATPPRPAVPTPYFDTQAGDHESFSFTVSHDLRAPIRVVEGFTKIVKEDYGRLLDKVGNDHLDRVLGAAARMNNMIDALLALSKLSSQPLAQQPVNLSQLARYVVDDLGRQWPERKVEVEIEPDMLVQGDPTLLRVVVENLLGNAWKYTGKSTEARIAFRRHATDPSTFTVLDNGAGFDMRFADRLFGVFQRLHSASDFPGTGVGLASVRRIVRRHGGEIWGEAEVNRGATFHFSLPSEAAGRSEPTG